METWKWVFLAVVAALAALMVLSVRGPVEQMSLTTELADPFVATDVTFSHGDITLAGTLTVPHGEGPQPGGDPDFRKRYPGPRTRAGDCTWIPALQVDRGAPERSRNRRAPSGAEMAMRNPPQSSWFVPSPIFAVFLGSGMGTMAPLPLSGIP